MTTGTRFLSPIFTALDQNGSPIPGAKLFFYTNNTTIQKQIYSDVDLTIAQGQPVVADSAGRFLKDMFLSNESYAVELQDQNGARIWLKNDCNVQVPVTSSAAFPFPGAVIEFYGTQNQLNVALSAFWYVMDGSAGTPNINGKYIKSCIDVADIGLTGGTTTPTGTVGGHSLTIAEMPVHSFYNGVASTNGNGMVYGKTATDVPGVATAYESTSAGAINYQGLTNTLGSGSTHTHSLTMNTIEPPFFQMIKLLYIGF